jgi:hypothetical protein
MHLVTPPNEEAHDRPLMAHLMILLQSIQNSHYFGELLERKWENFKMIASLTAGIYEEEEDGQ